MNLIGTVSMAVEVSEWRVSRAAIELLRQAYGLLAVDGVDDKGRMYQCVEYHTSHSWTDREDRGEPTKEQLEALSAIALLEDLPKRMPK